MVTTSLYIIYGSIIIYYYEKEEIKVFPQAVTHPSCRFVPINVYT